MAVFSDQFERHNPLTFEGYGAFDILLLALAEDARALLAERRTRSELTIICQHLEAQFAQRLSVGAEPQGRLAINCGESRVLHEVHSRNEELCPTLPFKAFEWERHAAFVLWKVVDVCDLDDLAHSHPEMELTHWQEGCATLAAACTALQIAGIEQGMVIGGVGIERVVRATERNARSEKARQSVRVKWRDRDEHKAFALEMNSKLKVRFRMEAARQIADAIELKFNPTSYDVDTIDRWLRDSGWVATK